MKGNECHENSFCLSEERNSGANYSRWHTKLAVLLILHFMFCAFSVSI